MGSFIGHAIPGSFFIFFGIWGTINQFMRFHQSRQFNMAAPYHNSPTFKYFCLCGQLKTWEVEGFLKVFFTSIGVFIELYGGLRHWPVLSYSKGQHATMYFFFGMSGVLDIMLHHNAPLPKPLAYISMCLALMVEGVLFKYHIHDKSELDQTIHTLIVYLIILTIILLLIEMKLPHSVLAGLAKSFFMIVQGTWFWQIGFILYNPLTGAEPWDGNNHEQILIVTMIFAWHLGAVFILQMIIGGAVAAIYKFKGGPLAVNQRTQHGGNKNAQNVQKTEYERVLMEESDEMI